MTGWAIPWRPLITQVMNRLYIQDSGQTYRNTTYQAYTKPTHQLGELVTAGIEKLLEITKIASPASRLKAAAAKELMYNTEQGNYSNLVYLEGHSRGTMTLSNALRVLAGFNVGDTKLEVLAYNPAAEGNRLNTTYQAYTKPTHQLGELVTAGIEKLLEITKIASPASRLKAAAAKELMYNAEDKKYTNPIYLEGHSRGTMKLSNALRVLAADHVFSDTLEIRAYNPAAEGNRLAEAAALVTKKPVKTWAPPKDFVANKIGGYAGNATFHDLWEIFQTNYSVHSSGGTAALGSDSNHVNAPELFSYEGLDIKDMNARRQGRTIGLLQQWQKTPSPENPVATQLTQLQRLLWQSGQWQQQLDNTPGLLTRPTPTTPDAPSARQQQLQQLRQSLTPY
ncbi:hemagglutinin [Xylella fastidiosa]|nr:hemagglutinin [Xylella fastidiosa]TNV98728.1 hemagglutinin [Xylella fastidiosa]TNV98804.1 hemagglutinin [Xylella fastidiosa]